MKYAVIAVCAVMLAVSPGAFAKNPVKKKMPAMNQPVPPTVAKKPYVVKAPFGAERNDEYYWLRDDERKNPEMLAYLNA